MSAKFDDFEVDVADLFEATENCSLTTKLDRRRRIEELEEERRLREELSEFA